MGEPQGAGSDTGTNAPANVGLDGRSVDLRGDPSHSDWTSDGSAAAAPSNQAVGGERPTWAPPELPQHFLRETPEETMVELNKAYLGARRMISARGEVPDDPGGYDIKFQDALAPYAEELEDDPVLRDFLGLLHTAGVTTAQAEQIVSPMLELLLNSGNVEAADFDAEIAKLVPNEARGLGDGEQRTAAGRRIEDALAFVTGAKAQGLDGEVADFLVAQLADDARGIKAIEFFRAQGRKIQPALGGAGGGAMTDAELDARLKDARYDARGMKFDRTFAEETDRLFRQRYAGGGVGNG